MAQIHPTAVVETTAQLAADVVIGPYCVIGPEVLLEKGVHLHSHVVVDGKTRIGEATKIFPFASLGLPPQDLKYKGEASSLSIGKHCVIREHVTMNPGTEGGGMKTQIGDYCLFMVGSHVAHDCRIGNHVILANNATLAGHVQVGDHTIIGGLAAVHQFVRIGKHAIIGGLSGVENDVIPYGSVMGERAELAGLNLVGLKRRNFARESIHALRNAYKELFESDNATLAERVERIGRQKDLPSEVREMLNFIREESDRALCTPRNRRESV